MNKKLRAFNIEIDDIETINFENGMLQQIARKCAEEYDLKRLELVLNGNIITAKDKFTGINSYMGMRVSLEPLEKDISFIIRPTNKPTYDELEKENQELKRKLNEAIHKATEFESEVYELKKQLENYKKLGFKHLQDKNNNLEAQQKEFIEYMNKTIKELECDDVDDEEIKGYLIQRIDTFKEILSKYREIIGE